LAQDVLAQDVLVQGSTLQVHFITNALSYAVCSPDRCGPLLFGHGD